MRELKFYCFGNGTTIYRGNDQVGHISEHGHVKMYDDIKLSKEDNEIILKQSLGNKSTFLETWNKKDVIQKWNYMLDIPTIGCGFNAVQQVQWDNRDKTIEEQVEIMEPVFFEMHM